MLTYISFNFTWLNCSKISSYFSREWVKCPFLNWRLKFSRGVRPFRSFNISMSVILDFLWPSREGNNFARLAFSSSVKLSKTCSLLKMTSKKSSSRSLDGSDTCYPSWKSTQIFWSIKVYYWASILCRSSPTASVAASMRFSNCFFSTAWLFKLNWM